MIMSPIFALRWGGGDYHYMSYKNLLMVKPSERLWYRMFPMVTLWGQDYHMYPMLTV